MSSAVLVAAVRRGLRTELATASRALEPERREQPADATDDLRHPEHGPDEHADERHGAAQDAETRGRASGSTCAAATASSEADEPAERHARATARAGPCPPRAHRRARRRGAAPRSGATRVAARAGTSEDATVTSVPTSSGTRIVAADTLIVVGSRPAPVSVPSSAHSVAWASADAGEHADRRGPDAEESCLEQDRAAQLRPAGADAAQQRERPGALGDEHLERVRDDEPCDQQRDGREAEHEHHDDVRRRCRTSRSTAWSAASCLVSTSASASGSDGRPGAPRRRAARVVGTHEDRASRRAVAAVPAQSGRRPSRIPAPPYCVQAPARVVDDARTTVAGRRSRSSRRRASVA